MALYVIMGFLLYALFKGESLRNEYWMRVREEQDQARFELVRQYEIAIWNHQDPVAAAKTLQKIR